MKGRLIWGVAGLCLISGGCGGGSDPVTDGEAPDMLQTEATCAAPASDGSPGDGLPVSVPWPDRYQNGFVVTRLLIENVVTGDLHSVQFSTDQERRQVSNPDPLGNRVPGLFYDAEGRVTEIDSLTGTSVPVAVSYHADGTISRLRDDRLDSSEEVLLAYEDGRLARRTRVGNFNGLPEPQVSAICYRYDVAGRLVEAVHQDPATGMVLPAQRDRFSLDEDGNIIEITKAIDSDGGYAARHVLTYDNAGNITRHEIYASDGALQRVASLIYEVSAQPAPNLFGFLSAINPDFVPLYESTLP